MFNFMLVDYVTYLAAGVGLTVWVAATLRGAAARFLSETLGDRSLADSVSRLLTVGFLLVGLGGVALLLQLDDGAVSAAGLVRAIATRIGLVLLMLGGLLGITVLGLRHVRSSSEAESRPGPATEYEPLPRGQRRFPY